MNKFVTLAIAGLVLAGTTSICLAQAPAGGAAPGGAPAFGGGTPAGQPGMGGQRQGQRPAGQPGMGGQRQGQRPAGQPGQGGFGQGQRPAGQPGMGGFGQGQRPAGQPGQPGMGGFGGFGGGFGGGMPPAGGQPGMGAQQSAPGTPSVLGQIQEKFPEEYKAARKLRVDDPAAYREKMRELQHKLNASK